MTWWIILVEVLVFAFIAVLMAGIACLIGGRI